MRFRRPDRYRPTWSLDTAVLHGRHVLLAAVVAGLLVGPRSTTMTVLLAAAAVTAGVLAYRRATRAAPPRLGGPAAQVPSGPGRSGGAGRHLGPRPDRHIARAARPFCVLCLAVAAAVLVAALVAEARLASLDRTFLRPAPHVELRGTVVEAPRTRAFGLRVVPVELSAGRAAGERVLVRVFPRTVLPRLEIGREVKVSGRLRWLRPREEFERRRGIHAVLEAERIVTGRWRGTVLDRIRRRAEDALNAGLGPETGALARGMVLGQDHALPDDLRDAFRAAGLSHLVAASGANVMLLAALVLALGALAGVELRLRLALALVAVLAYVPIAGGGPSIQRAGIMGAAGLVAAMAGRPATRWYALLLAAAVTLTLNPRACEEPGWQLSFAAVVAILALHRRLRGAMTDRRVPGAVADAAALTIAATLGTAPLIALHFNEVSLVSLPANLLAAPAVAPVMWLGTLAGVLGGEAAMVLDAVAALPLAYLAWLGRTAAAVPNATIPVDVPGPVAAAAVYAAMAGVATSRVRGAVRQWFVLRAPPRVAPRRGRVLVAWLAAGGGVLLLLAPAPAQPPRGFAVTALDVGHGDAILVQHGQHAVLFDTGPPGAPLVRELREAGVRRLDALVVTHSSADHESGVGAVFDAFGVGLVLDGRQTAAERSPEDGGEGGGVRFAGVPAGTTREVPAAGQRIAAGPIEIEILWPPPGASRAGDPNVTATVALVRAGNHSALLTADAESAVTLPLDLPRVDVLKVAHHGSEDEGLPALLEEVRPRHALIPVGRNTYGHPHPATLRALRAVPDVRRTDEDGTSRIELG